MKGIASTRFGIVLVFILAAIVATPVIASAAINLFVHIEGIPGESQDSRHIGWIDATRAYGDSLLSSFDYSGGITTGKTQFAPIKIVKFLDRASPLLRYSTASGPHIKDVIIQFWNTGPPYAYPIFEIRLFDVVITEVSTTWADSSSLPQEVVAFSFARIEWTYTTIAPDGKPGALIIKNWDVVTNRPF
jgi:type VI secretion system secreted protein Hcp